MTTFIVIGCIGIIYSILTFIANTYCICLQKGKPPLQLHEVCVFSFRWKLDQNWQNIQKTVASTDYRCPNGDRWRGLLVCKKQKLSLYAQLTSAVIPVTVEVR